MDTHWKPGLATASGSTEPQTHGFVHRATLFNFAEWQPKNLISNPLVNPHLPSRSSDLIRNPCAIMVRDEAPSSVQLGPAAKWPSSSPERCWKSCVQNPNGFKDCRAVDCIFPRARPCNPQLGASRWTSQSPNALAEESHLLLASRSRAFYCHGF